MISNQSQQYALEKDTNHENHFTHIFPLRDTIYAVVMDDKTGIPVEKDAQIDDAEL